MYFSLWVTQGGARASLTLGYLREPLQGSGLVRLASVVREDCQGGACFSLTLSILFGLSASVCGQCAGHEISHDFQSKRSRPCLMSQF